MAGQSDLTGQREALSNAERDFRIIRGPINAGRTKSSEQFTNLRR